MKEIYTPMENALIKAIIALDENIEAIKQKQDELTALKEEVEL
jgi:hypothetical protein